MIPKLGLELNTILKESDWWHTTGGAFLVCDASLNRESQGGKVKSTVMSALS